MKRYITIMALALFVLVACEKVDPLQLACSSLASANNIATAFMDVDKLTLDQIDIVLKANDIAGPICSSEERPSNTEVAIRLVSSAVSEIENLIGGIE